MTCTDAAVLCGTYPEVCYAKYGSVPIRSRYLHEMSLRILIHCIDSIANKHQRYIVPWISISVDFYVRVFVRVYESKLEVLCINLFIFSVTIYNLRNIHLIYVNVFQR